MLQTALGSGDDEGALALAEKALDLHPHQGWILKIVYDLQIRQRLWTKAEKMLARVENAGVMAPEVVRSDRLALYLAQAEKDLADGYSSDALYLIKKLRNYRLILLPQLFYWLNFTCVKGIYVRRKMWC